ncbi:MAG: PLDc_N domain-containing protein [Gammaproteobacteria bacterium]|nr:PLDc_N domain-containing protein [Gammaproteobacteria bacterium]
MEYGILGLLIFFFDLYAIVKTLNSGATTGAKVIWTLVILFLPVLGLIAWWLAGPKAALSYQ